MSDLILENIVGFKAVDKNGNEQNVTVDEMVDMVSTRMVMALSETSTFAAAAATGNDVYENELPTVTDAANVRVLQSSGDAAKMTMQSLASKLEKLVFKYTLISLLSELDGLLWNNTSPGSIYTFNSTSDYDSKKHPFGAAGTVEVKRFGGSSTIQILYDINNHVFLRRKVGEEAWNAWTQV